MNTATQSVDQAMTKRCQNTVTKLTEAFIRQDIDAIMEQFAEDSCYCDLRGSGQRGAEYVGKQAIREVFLRQFYLMGDHTFEAPTIIADGRTAFSSWTLVLGDPADPQSPRFEGADHFELDDDAKVTLKKAWLKGQRRLGWQAMLRHPLRALKHPRYALAG